VGGAWLIMGGGRREEEDPALYPMITGERGGLGHVILNVVGGLLAVPFVLFRYTLNALDSLAGVAAGDAADMSGEAGSPGQAQG